MLLFIGVIIWNVERILYYTYQSLTQCAAVILTSTLNTPYEHATFHTCWSESLEISTHPGPNSFKKTFTHVHPTRIEVYFYKDTQVKFFFLIQIKRVHTMKWSSNCSQYMFPRPSEFFEFACIKLIPRCILQINCEEYKHRDCCPKTRWKVVVMKYFLSCILYNDL